MDRWPHKPQVATTTNGGVLLFVANEYKELSPQQAIELGNNLVEAGKHAEHAAHAIKLASDGA